MTTVTRPNPTLDSHDSDIRLVDETKASRGAAEVEMSIFNETVILLLVALLLVVALRF
jgi:hypothetical protein